MTPDYELECSPDELRMRQQVDVVSIKKQELDEGPLLHLWVSLPPQITPAKYKPFTFDSMVSGL